MLYTGETIYIRFLDEKDVKAMLELQQKNREFFEPFVTTRTESYYTYDYQMNIVKEGQKKRQDDIAYSFGIFSKETNGLLGTISLTEVLRGSLQSCFIGYVLDRDFNGKGIMTEAVKFVIDYAFNELSLHRIEAGVMPHNIGSIRVLEKAGFEKEGIARKNVMINGKWQDHQVLAIINEKM